MQNVVVGDLFTVTRNKAIVCRSYIENIWRCVSETETQIWGVSVAGDFWGVNGTGKGEPRCFAKHEHDFSRCPESALAPLNASKKEDCTADKAEPEKFFPSIAIVKAIRESFACDLTPAKHCMDKIKALVEAHY